MKALPQKYIHIKFYILLLLTATLPFHIHISSILILSATFLYLIRLCHLKTFNFGKIDKISLLFASYFIVEIIGLFYTEQHNLSYGLSFLEKHHALILFPLIFQDFLPDRNQSKRLFQSFVVGCFTACIICIVVNIYYSIELYDTFIHPWRFSHLRLAEPIGLTPVYLSLYVGFAIFILLESLLNELWLTLSERAAISLLLLFFLLVLIALGARTVTVTVMVIVFLRILNISLTKKSFKTLAVSLLIPLFFAIFIFLNPVAKMRFLDMFELKYERSNYGSYFARWKIWEPGLEIIKENIFTGVGTGDHQAELDQKFIEYNYLEGVGFFNMHNQYLQTLLTHGLGGLLILLSIFVIQMRKGLQEKDLLYVSFLVLFMLGCVTESMLNRNKGLILFLLFSFIFYKSRKSK